MPHPTPTRSSPRDPALDGLRGLAVLMVFVFHYGGGLKSPHAAIRLLGRLTQAGWIGVTLFFALSGFLITGILWDSLGQPHFLRNFYARRVLRIFPVYYLALGLATFIYLARGALFSELHPIVLYVFFLQDLPVLATQALTQHGPLQLYHLWSLAVEEQFYLLWPALLLLCSNRRQALRLSLGTFALASLFCLTIYGLPWFSSGVTCKLFDTFFLTHAGALALGAALALALRGPEWPRVQRWALPSLLAATAIYLLVSYLCGSLYLTPRLQFVFGLPAVSAACAAAIPVYLRPGAARRIASTRPLRWLGRISYGFYVFHILLQPLFDHITVHTIHLSSGARYQAVRCLIAFVLTAAISWISYEVIEIPFLHLNRRFPLHHPRFDQNPGR